MPHPSGYGHSHEKLCISRRDCSIGVGFDRQQGDIVRFLVDLQYTESFTPPDYTQIARIDHNSSPSSGHDIRTEGIHVDVRSKHGQNRKYYPHYSHVPHRLGAVIQASADYFHQNASFFVDFYEGAHSPPTAPPWIP